MKNAAATKKGTAARRTKEPRESTKEGATA
jgi:hypothetical protein